MNFKKINAVLSLIASALALEHIISYTVWMLSRGRVSFVSPFPFLQLFACCVILHAILGICMVVVTRRESAGNNKVRQYSKLNFRTVLQRISAILILLLLPLHIMGSKSYFSPVALHAVMQPLFFAAVLTHISVSLSKSFITLGIGASGFIKITDIAAAIFCGILMITSAAGFYLCLFGGVAH